MKKDVSFRLSSKHPLELFCLRNEEYPPCEIRPVFLYSRSKPVCASRPSPYISVFGVEQRKTGTESTFSSVHDAYHYDDCPHNLVPHTQYFRCR